MPYYSSWSCNFQTEVLTLKECPFILARGYHLVYAGCSFRNVVRSYIKREYYYLRLSFLQYPTRFLCQSLCCSFSKSKSVNFTAPTLLCSSFFIFLLTDTLTNSLCYLLNTLCSSYAVFLGQTLHSLKLGFLMFQEFFPD